MLLSAALALSSLPMMASAAGTSSVAIGTNLLTDVDNLSLVKVYDYKDTVVDDSGALVDTIPLDEFTSTGTATITTDGGFVDGNSYVSYTSRLNNNDGIRIYFEDTAPAETTTDQYEFKFDVRVPADIKKSDGTVTNSVQFRTYVSDGGAGTKSLASNVTLSGLDTWQTITIDYDATTHENGFIVRGGPGLGFNSHNGAAPFEIDNVRLVKKGTETVVGNYIDTFDGCTVSGLYVTGGSFNYRAYHAYGLNNFNNTTGKLANLVIETEEAYVNSSFTGATGTVTYTPDDVVLEPGFYYIKGEFRNADYVGAGVHNMSAAADSAYIVACPDSGDTKQRIIYDNNVIKVSSSVALGEGAGAVVETSGTVFADAAWTELAYAFRVDETTTLSELKFNFEHVLNGTTLSPKANVDFKNITISAYEDLPAEEAPENAQIFDIAENQLVSSGNTSIASNNGLVLGNEFMALSGRINNNDGIVITFNGEMPEETTAEYELKFDVRTSVEIKNATGLTNNQYQVRVYPSNEAGTSYTEDVAYTNVVLTGSDSWQTVTVDYDTARYPYGMLLRGGPGLGFSAHNGAVPCEIDNVRLVIKGTDTVVANYTEDFTDAVSDGAAIVGDAFIFNVNRVYSNQNLTLSVEEDVIYNKTVFDGTTGTLTYTLADDTVLEPGSYTLVGKFRNSEYVNAGVPDELKLDTAHFGGSGVNYDKPGSSVIDQYADRAYIVALPNSGSQGGGTGGTPQRIVNDNNAVYIIASIVTDTDGKERTRSSEVLNVDSGWTEFRYTVILKEATTLKEIKFNVTHALDGSPLNVAETYVDFKDLELVFFPEEGRKGGIPNLGIVMMLMHKRGGNVDKLPTAELTAVEAGTTAGEAVTAYDAKSFKAEVVDNGGNKYMTCTNRINNGDGITVKDIGLNLDSSKSYEVKFDIRASVDVVKIASHNEGQTYVRVWYGQNAKTGVESIFVDDAWTTVTVPYVADQVKAGLHIVGGIGATYAHPFDIDNIRVVEAGTNNVVASVDFENVDAKVFAADEIYSVNGLEFIPKYMYSDAENGKDATVAIEVDNAYARASLTSTASKVGFVDYKAEATLEPGTYTLTAMVRNGNFNGSNNDISVNTAPNYIMREPDNSTTTTRQRITENNNYVNVVASVVTNSIVFTSEAAPVNTWAAWTPVEYTFVVTEAVNVSSIRFGATHALLDTELAVTDVTLDVKDIVISKAK